MKKNPTHNLQKDLWLVLHIVDHCPRFLASVVIPNKQPKTIVKSIFKNWIIKHGSSNQIKSNIWFTKQVPTTQWWWVAAAESPWSKSVTERHNQILDLERHNQILELWFKSGSSLVYQCQKLTLQYPRFLSLPIGYRY